MRIVKQHRKGQGTAKVGRVMGLVAAATCAAAFSAGGISPAEAQTPRVHGTTTPDYHVIRDGDTIWDLSGSYYGDPYQWPRMWSYNPHITNPHWVYPGDIVYLKQVQRQQAQNGGAGASAAASQQEEPVSFGMHLPLGGVITAEEMEYVGRIIGSPKEATMLAEHDSVWLGFGEDGYTENEREQVKEEDRTAMSEVEPAVGDVYAVVRLDGTLKDDEGNEVGNKYYILGSVQVTEVQEGYATKGIITQGWREIERGDLLVPYERQLRVVQPVQGSDDVVAQIVDSLQAGFNFGEHQYVFINRGAEDGVRVGNRFFIYQRWEGLQRQGTDPDDEIPWQRVGQVLVLDVRENHSTAVITDSSREILIGDRLEMYRGH